MYERYVYLLSKLLSSTGRVQTQNKEFKIPLCCHIFLEHDFFKIILSILFLSFVVLLLLLYQIFVDKSL